MNGLNSRTSMTKKIISEFEGRTTEITQSKQNENKLTNEQSLKDLYGV